MIEVPLWLFYLAAVLAGIGLGSTLCYLFK